MNNIASISIVIGACLLLIVLLGWYGGSTTNSELLLNDEYGDDFQTPLTPEEQKVTNPTNINEMNPKAIITTNKGVVELELFADTMPVTTNNFIKLAEEGFYNGTKFHRVIEGFMIQGGDPNSKTENETTYGTGGPGYAIADEHVAGELLTNTRGTIAMANSGPNSGGSQWFINLGDNSYLDFDKQPLSSKHPVFGRVVAGMDVVDEIGSVATKERDIPAEPIVIETISITRN